MTVGKGSIRLAAGLLFVAGCGDPPSAPEPNTAPSVDIVSPAAGSTFAGGDELAIQLRGVDAEDGTLGATALSWWAILHHAEHTHPFLPVASGAVGTASIPRVGHVETDIFYRIYARAVDSEGAADTTFVDVAPRLVTLSFETVPAGLTVTVDGQPRVTPAELPGIVGVQRQLGAPTPQDAAGRRYEFASWAHGGAREQAFVTPEADTTLTASFDDVGIGNAPPEAAITSPSAGDTVTAGTPVTVTASAADPDGTVTAVHFLVDGDSVGSDDAEPYSVDWTPTGTGTRELTVRAIDDGGASTLSEGVSVLVRAAGGGDVLAPVVTLTSPTAGSMGLTGAVELTATATDDVGVTRVEFQVDGETVGTDDVAPYAFTLPATGAYTTGAHTVRARATDAAGNRSAWSAATVTFGGNVDLPAGFTRTTYASGLNGGFPNALTGGVFLPDGRLFVLELQGAVRVVDGGVLLPDPILELDVEIGGELGLTGIVLDPDFATNGYLYLHYITGEGGTRRGRIGRFTVDGASIDSTSEVVIVELEPISSVNFHVGGGMAFGPDGTLYVAVGDNGNGLLSQSLTSEFGKILRYNADGSVPTDNPFYGSATGRYRAIWALGLRNPFTLGFHSVTGRLHVNDVGQDTWEEINEGLPGANYGWPTTEGPTADPAFVSPLLAYRHSGSPTLFDGSSVVGAVFYEPTVDLFGAAYTGDYFFADYVDGWIYRMDSDAWDTAYAFARLELGVTNLVLGPDGALYVLVNSRVDRISR